MKSVNFTFKNIILTNSYFCFFASSSSKSTGTEPAMEPADPTDALGPLYVLGTPGTAPDTAGQLVGPLCIELNGQKNVGNLLNAWNLKICINHDSHLNLHLLFLTFVILLFTTFLAFLLNIINWISF